MLKIRWKWNVIWEVQVGEKCWNFVLKASSSWNALSSETLFFPMFLVDYILPKLSQLCIFFFLLFLLNFFFFTQHFNLFLLQMSFGKHFVSNDPWFNISTLFFLVLLLLFQYLFHIQSKLWLKQKIFISHEPTFLQTCWKMLNNFIHEKKAKLEKFIFSEKSEFRDNLSWSIRKVHFSREVMFIRIWFTLEIVLYFFVFPLACKMS